VFLLWFLAGLALALFYQLKGYQLKGHQLKGRAASAGAAA
jgi:hypothetical protein